MRDEPHLEGFEILQKLGEGGAARVYLARQHSLDRLVAIKCLRQDRLDEEALARLSLEATTLARLSFPGIVAVHDVITEDSGVFMIMEYLPGGSLRDHLKSPMSLRQALRITVQLARALQHAHDHGLVHRDLKPENVIFRDNDTPVITDFGIVFYLDTSQSQRLTTRGTFLGTPTYLSPEQINGERASAQSDLYSLGVMLYEMLTGKPPFEGETNHAIMFGHMSQPVPSLPDAFSPLQPILDRLLAKEPEDRFDSAEALLEALTETLRSNTALLDEAVGQPVLSVPERLHTLGLTTRTTNAFNTNGSVRSRSGVRSAPMVIAGLVLLVVASFLVYWLNPGSVAPPDVNRLSIAVLPFENLSPDPDDAYLAEGIHEDIIIKLSRIGSIRTIARRSVQEFAGSDLEQISDELNVGSILEGSVRRSGDRIRVAVQHVDTRTRETLWAESYLRGEITDLFEIQSAIAEQIVSALEASLSPNEQEQLRQRPTEIAQAHTFYLQGRASLRKEGTLENLKEAAEYFEQALEQDSEYGLAMAGLCTAQWQQYDLTRDSGQAEEAINTCRQADRYDSLAETHVALANLYLGTGELDQAWSALERALDLAPGNAEAHSVRGRVRAARGEMEAAENDIRKAIELDPGYWRHYNDLGILYFTDGRYELAAEQFSHAIDLEPSSPHPYSNLGAVLVHLGEYLKGADAIRQSIELRPTDRAYSNAGVNYFYAGNYSEAEAMFEEAIAMNPSNFLYHGHLGDAIELQEDRGSEAAAHYEDAIRLARERLEVNPNDHSTRALIALYLARLGKADAAREELRSLSEVEQLDYYAEQAIGMAEIFLGKEETAIEHLQRAIDLGYPRDLLKADPNLEPLSDHPAFQDLMRDDSS